MTAISSSKVNPVSRALPDSARPPAFNEFRMILEITIVNYHSEYFVPSRAVPCA